MKKGTWLLLLINLVCLVLLILNYHGRTIRNYHDCHDTVAVEKRETIIIRDTLSTVITPRPIERTILRTDTILKDTVLEHISVHTKDTLNLPSCTAILDVFASGVDVGIDSVKIDAQITTTQVEITKYVERPKKLKDRIHISPQIGVGYGLINNKPDIFVGIGLSIDL